MKLLRTHLIGLLLVVLVLPACSGSSGAAERDPKTPLRIAFGTDVTTLNPWMTKSVSTDMSVISQIYQTLTVRTPDLSIKPLLATSWEHPAPDTWTFKLRKGVTFANGDPFDSSVVKWNIEKVKDPATKARIAPNMDVVESVGTPDPSTVTIKTKTADTTMPSLMSYFYFVSPDWAKDHDLADEPMGTGPYELSKWDRNSLVKLKAREKYWGKKVSFSEVEYKIMPDPSGQIAALQTQEVDVISEISPDQMSRVKGIPDVKAGAIPTIRSAFLMLNTETKELEDPQVRRALNYAVDKKGIVKNLFDGLTTPSPGQALTKEYAGFNSELTAYPHDPDKAKDLLAEAGHSEGLELTLTYPSNSYLLADKVVQVVKDQLADVGVTLNIKPEPFASWLANMYDGKIADIVYLTYAWPTLDGVDLLRNFGPGGAQSFWTNREFGAALEDGQATADSDKHAEAISRAAAIMREEAPFVFLMPQPLTYAHHTSVDWKPRPDDWVRANEMSAR